MLLKKFGLEKVTVDPISDPITPLLKHYLMPTTNLKCHSTVWNADTPPPLQFLAVSCVFLTLTLFSFILNSSYFQKPTLTCHTIMTLNLFLQPRKSSTYMSTLWLDTEMSSIQGIGITCGIFVLDFYQDLPEKSLPLSISWLLPAPYPGWVQLLCLQQETFIECLIYARP